MGDLRAAGIHHRSLGYAGASSLDALRKASDTSYYKDNERCADAGTGGQVVVPQRVAGRLAGWASHWDWY